MKKPRTLLPDATFTFDDTAVALLRTSFRNYEFVMAFNRAFNLQLSRVDDLPVDDTNHPCFSFYNEHTRLAFVMIERPAPDNPSHAAVFDYYDKLLLIRGRDAWDFQSAFYRLVTDTRPEPPQEDFLEHREWEERNQLCEGIFSIDTCSFSSRRGTTTSLHPGTPDTMPRQTATFVRRLKQYLETVFETLQWHLCDEEEL